MSFDKSNTWKQKLENMKRESPDVVEKATLDVQFNFKQMNMELTKETLDQFNQLLNMALKPPKIKHLGLCISCL